MSDKPFAGEQHEVTVVNREQMRISGVVNVDSFDDQEIVLDTDLGTLTVKGEDLHIKQLNLEQGSFNVEGLVVALQYSTGRIKGQVRGRGLLDRLLR